MDIIAARIKEERQKLGITQQQLAFDTGLSVGGIQSLEIGRAKPNVDTLIKLADRFGCTSDYLIGRTDNPSQTKDLNWSEFQEKIKELEILVGDNPKSVDILRKLAKTFPDGEIQMLGPDADRAMGLLRKIFGDDNTPEI